jgi:lipopolysaccharide transport system permease protein
LSVAIFTVVFGYLVKVPSDGYPYPVFVLARPDPLDPFLLGRRGFRQLPRGLGGADQQDLFPPAHHPAASIGSALVDFAFSAAFLLAIMPLFGVPWSPSLLWLPVLLLLVFFLALGVGALFSALIVSYRDFVGLMGYLLQVWMYATPIVYPASLFPERWRWVLYLNPMAGLTEGFRAAFLGKPMEPGPLALSSIMVIAAMGIGVAYFGKTERRFADVI